MQTQWQSRKAQAEEEAGVARKQDAWISDISRGAAMDNGKVWV